MFGLSPQKPIKRQDRRWWPLMGSAGDPQDRGRRDPRVKPSSEVGKLENPHKSGGLNGKTMGKPWENHGKTIGKCRF